MIDYKKEYERLKKIYEPETKIKRGDIVFVNMKAQNINEGDVQQYSRPYLIVSNDVGNHFSTICLGVPLTSKDKKVSQPTHLRLSYRDSVLLCEQIRTLNQSEIDKVKAHLDDREMQNVDKCLKVSLGINL